MSDVSQSSGCMLDGLVRTWLASDRKCSHTWSSIEEEVRFRTIRRARRFGLPQESWDDLLGEVYLNMLRVLNSPRAMYVESFDAYVLSIIQNMCRREIIATTPVWSKLKADVVETLRGRRAARGFALWISGGVVLGGYAEWESQLSSKNPSYLLLQNESDQLRAYVYRLGAPEQMDLGELLSAIFNWLGRPFQINELTSLIFAFRGLKERQTELGIGDADTVVTESQEDYSPLIQAIGAGFSSLPRSEAIALLFHLQAEAAERLVLYMSAGERVSLPLQLAIPEEELSRYLDGLPWRDLQIASLLQIEDVTNHRTQMHIVRLRQRAIQSIRRSMQTEP
jgi:hypothetical protein